MHTSPTHRPWGKFCDLWYSQTERISVWQIREHLLFGKLIFDSHIMFPFHVSQCESLLDLTFGMKLFFNEQRKCCLSGVFHFIQNLGYTGYKNVKWKFKLPVRYLASNNWLIADHYKMSHDWDHLKVFWPKPVSIHTPLLYAGQH